MATIRLSESELRRVRGYRFGYNARGYILMEFGRDFVDHVRLDLEKQGERFYTTTWSGQNGTSQYRVREFHVKLAVGAAPDWLYMGFEYIGGGVWSRCWSKFQSAGGRQHVLTDGEQTACVMEARSFLRALREVTTDMDQMLAIDAPPEVMRDVA